LRRMESCEGFVRDPEVLEIHPGKKAIEQDSPSARSEPPRGYEGASHRIRLAGHGAEGVRHPDRRAPEDPGPGSPIRPPWHGGEEVRRTGVGARPGPERPHGLAEVRRGPRASDLRGFRFLPDALEVRALWSGTEDQPSLWHDPDRPFHWRPGRHGRRRDRGLLQG